MLAIPSAWPRKQSQDDCSRSDSVSAAEAFAAVNRVFWRIHNSEQLLNQKLLKSSFTSWLESPDLRDANLRQLLQASLSGTYSTSVFPTRAAAVAVQSGGGGAADRFLHVGGVGRRRAHSAGARRAGAALWHRRRAHRGHRPALPAPLHQEAHRGAHHRLTSELWVGRMHSCTRPTEDRIPACPSAQRWQLQRHMLDANGALSCGLGWRGTHRCSGSFQTLGQVSCRR